MVETEGTNGVAYLFGESATEKKQFHNADQAWARLRFSVSPLRLTEQSREFFFVPFKYQISLLVWQDFLRSG